MTARDDVIRLMELYPRVFFACHLRHVRDPDSGERISARQASILDHLDAEEGTSMTGLAEHMGVTASTMSLSIDRLERRGYVQRCRDPKDGRRVLLVLTESGERIREAQTVLDPDLVGQLLDELPVDDRAAALDGLQLLASAAGRLMTKRSRGGEIRS